MSEHRDERSNGNGCVMNLLLLAILAVLIFSVFGGALEAGTQRTITIFPPMTPAPGTLMIAPTSAPVFVEVQPVVQPVDDCASADPTAPVPNYEVGVGGVLPDCYAQWTREQQNQFLRSH